MRAETFHQPKLGSLSPALMVGEVEEVRVQGGSSLHPQIFPWGVCIWLTCWVDRTVLIDVPFPPGPMKSVREDSGVHLSYRGTVRSI